MYCDNCKITFESDTGCCPLCHEKLGDIKTLKRIFPPRNKMISKSQFDFFAKLYFFVSFIAVVVSGLINYLAVHQFTWSAVILCSLIYVYTLVKQTILAKSNLGFKIMLQAVLMSFLLYVIDYFTTDNAKWSLEYAIPFVLVATTLSLTALAFSNYKKWRDYVVYILATVVIGIVPFVFYVTNVIDTSWPSIVSFLYSMFTIIGMLIFYRKKLTNEIKKNFHI